MKDLKENIKKNNMKKIMLSAVLGMFCYCTNNAMKKPIKLDDVIVAIINYQISINNAAEPIDKYRKKIYSTIKDANRKVTKKNVLDFIQNQISTEEKNDEELKNDIKTIEQYFHLEEIKNDNDECNEENLTETFWTETETEEDIKDTLTTEETTKIKEYFNTIIKAENDLSTVFNSYYNEKKIQKEEETEENILGEIMKELCGEEEGVTASLFIKYLKKRWETAAEEILVMIKRRITLSNAAEQEEKDFISFIKQKIGIEEKKENNPGGGKGGNPAKEEGCPCCNDCCGNE